jgi:phosphate transport system substrate-binding protein
VFPIVGSVPADTNGLEYTDMSYLHTTGKTLAIATAANGTFYPPSYEAVALADYPLSRLTYFVVNKVLPKQPLPAALQEFLRFLLSSKGQSIVRKQGLFLPLRGWQAKNPRTLFTWPSRFDGALVTKFT